ncbi:MAG: ATP-grasp domain-containing protein, partial [Bacteroidetes bacterium]|nr:ATP-grasp domain-containing protein [Bacteroidota bacterium]
FYQMALTFNKRDCLSVVKQYGIKTATSYLLNEGDQINTKKIISKVGLPCFVKPNKAGSSFGVSKVKKAEEMIPAIEKAFKEDSEILIESFLDGPEINVSILEFEGKLKVLPMTEIVSENEFFDYEAKYLGKSEEITPARISVENHKKLEKVATQVYQILNMRGFSRAEYILMNNEFYFLEINSVPGLTAASLIPQQAAAAGINLPTLFHNAIEMALNKQL